MKLSNIALNLRANYNILKLNDCSNNLKFVYYSSVVLILIIILHLNLYKIKEKTQIWKELEKHTMESPH